MKTNIQSSCIKGTTPDMVRIKTACEFFGMSESYFRHAIMKRTLPFYKLGKTVFLSVSEIQGLINNNKIETIN